MARSRRITKKDSSDAFAEARRELVRDAGGYDWGWPALELVSANPELARRLHAGGFFGCGYGLLSQDGPPFIALIGENLTAMKSVMALIREWVSIVGPNAVAIEILFDGQGYVISIGQQPDLLRWRLRGLDTTDHSLVVVISLVKRMDSRHPFLEEIANYSKQPIAPVVLTVATVPKGKLLRPGSHDISNFAPVMDGALTLPGVNVYTRPEDRPRGSMVMLESELAGRPRGLPPERAKDPASLARERERRLMSTFPKTMHVLRQRTAAQSIFEEARAIGCANWQIEQAVCNLRLPACLPYKPKSTSKRLAMLDQLRHEFIENASIKFDESPLNTGALFDQISLDAAYLLRRLDEENDLPETLKDRNVRLREMGYA